MNAIAPTSQGSIHIASADPQAYPVITANYNATQEDREIILSAARQLRQWAASEPLASLLNGETSPGPQAQSDAEILAAIDRQGCAGMHTVGSCRMGADAASVVDPELRVRGLEGLRVVDASVFPRIPAGNTQAPVLALAWLASEMILAGG